MRVVRLNGKTHMDRGVVHARSSLWRGVVRCPRMSPMDHVVVRVRLFGSLLILLDPYSFFHTMLVAAFGEELSVEAEFFPWTVELPVLVGAFGLKLSIEMEFLPWTVALSVLVGTFGRELSVVPK